MKTLFVTYRPQLVYLGLLLAGLLLALVNHGKEKGKQSFWGTLIGFIVNVFILYKGGFFN